MTTSKPLSTPITGHTFTTTIQPPPGPNTPLALPTGSNHTPPQNPPTFNDAMHVRTRVFIDEQHCSPEGEIDSDDPRSWQWVVYDSPASPAASESTSASCTMSSCTPVAVIRLVPPPHAPHALLTHLAANLPPYDWAHEPYIKLTRVAVLPSHRGLGLGRRLVETALTWAAAHAREIDGAAGRVAQESKIQGEGEVEVRPWRGLVLVHAQVDVERMYEGLGFVRDEGLGRWEEEGIMHVGMFRRVEVLRSVNVEEESFGDNIEYWR